MNDRKTTGMPQPAPHLHQRGREVQRFGTVIRMPLGLDQEACEASVRSLNQLLADTITLRDLYKKHHWQVGGPTFYALHLLFDKHFEEQAKLVDEIAERVQLLGGVSLAMAGDVAEESSLEKPPRGRESVPVQLSRLLDAHEHILIEARKAASEASDHHDEGTNDLLVSQVIRTNELQVWFLSQHLVDIPLVDDTESTRQPEAAMR
jgi:starvation-inducible DNA-binding protein